MGKINAKYIRTLNPCIEGIIEFERMYPDFNGTIIDLLRLENTSYSDKTWLITKVVDKSILQQWSVECAEFVVDIFNKEYPNDSRISDCIEITKVYLEGRCTIEELKEARSAAADAADAAYDATAGAADAAYDATAGAAAYDATAGAAAYAARSAAYATYAAAYAARSAAYATYAAAYAAARKDQEDINLSLLIALLDNNG